jgi:hypothetical protein
MQRTDVHQHLLGEPLIAALARRRTPLPRPRPVGRRGRRDRGLRARGAARARPADASAGRAHGGAGSTFAFGASDIHRVLHAGDEPAVTVHAYSPPLVRMGAYVVEDDGRLLRHTVSYGEELRPLGADPLADAPSPPARAAG